MAIAHRPHWWSPDVEFVEMRAKQASGRVSLNANQMSPPSAFLNSLNELNGTTQRCSESSLRF
jgi:hypothetical protein